MKAVVDVWSAHVFNKIFLSHETDNLLLKLIKNKMQTETENLKDVHNVKKKIGSFIFSDSSYILINTYKNIIAIYLKKSAIR